MEQQSKIPVTVITGFLGAGKTSLLQKILKEPHGKRIAVIENEYGALGLDHKLIDRVDEEVIIVQNGCICCSVRKDLIDAILQLGQKRALRALNTRAQIIEAEFGKVPLKEILNTGRFNLAEAQLSSGWMKVMRGEETSEKDEYGINSFVYNARKPFHPERFAKFLEQAPPGVLRAKSGSPFGGQKMAKFF